MTTPNLSIAICGAGIAGLTAAIALLKHPHITINIYEQATELKEIGASIALSPNGLRTLERLGLENAISDEVAYRGPSGIPMIYRHWKTNEVLERDFHVGVSEYKHRTARYLRAHLQEELLRGVDRERIHLGERFRGVESTKEGVRVEFVDGTFAEADLLLGADGLKSGVRQFFVPELKLKWGGLVSFRGVFDYDLVKGIPDLPLDSIHWWGPSKSFFASKLGKNKYTVVGSLNVNPEEPNPFNDVTWDQEASVKLFRDLFSDWNPVVKALVDVTPDVRYYPNLSIEGPLNSWVFGDRVTLIGDAAHAHGGAYATGGSLAIDDAYAFSQAVFHVFPPTATRKPTPAELGEALRLYEATRKDHAHRLLEIVHLGNKKKAEAVGKEVTDESLRKVARERPHTVWLTEHDVVAAFQDVLKKRADAREGQILPRL